MLTSCKIPFNGYISLDVVLHIATRIENTNKRERSSFLIHTCRKENHAWQTLYAYGLHTYIYYTI